MSRQSGRTQKFHVCSRWLTAALLRRKLDYRFGSIVFLGCLRHFRVRISLSILAGKMKSRLPYSPGAKRSRESLLRSRRIQFWTDTPKMVGTGPGQIRHAFHFDGHSADTSLRTTTNVLAGGAILT